MPKQWSTVTLPLYFSTTNAHFKVFHSYKKKERKKDKKRQKEEKKNYC